MDTITPTPPTQSRTITKCNSPHDATEDGKQILRGILRRGCECGSEEARVVKRANAAGVWSVCLQCMKCGRSLGSGIRRVDHPNWEEYPNWDEDIRRRYWREREENWRLHYQQRELEARQERDNRKAQYSWWLATSSEWRTARGKVMERSGWICEACLVAPAMQVHHLHYSAGKLPPAWLLKAVCVDCHNRLHDDADEWRGA